MPTPPHIPIRFDALLNKYTVIIALIAIAAAFYLTTANSRQCASICEAKGYAGHRFKPAGKYSNAAGSCYCLSAAEVAMEGRIPKGAQVPMQ